MRAMRIEAKAWPAIDRIANSYVPLERRKLKGAPLKLLRL